MKKDILIIWAVALFSAAVLQSCSEDKGNYDYIDLNDVEISEVESNYVVDQFSNLKITPKLSMALNSDESKLDFLWYMYVGKQIKADTLSYERNLDEDIKFSPGVYNAVYKITDKETGVFYTFEFEIKVTGTMTDGLVILSEIDKKANIAMLSASGNMYEDVFYSINGEYAGDNPVGLANMNTRRERGVLIFCDDKVGGSVVSPIGFSKLQTISDYFWIPEEFPKPVAYISGNRYDFMITENAFYDRDIMSPPPNKYGSSLGGEMSVFPEAFNKSYSGAYFYDNKSEGFKYKYSFDFGDIINMPDSLFNPAHIGMEMLSGGDGFKGDSYGLFYDDETGTHHSLIASYTQEYVRRFIPHTSLPITSATDVDKATCFDLSTLSPQHFYAVDNKLYCLNAKTGITKEVYAFDSGVKIDHFELEGKYDDSVMYIGTSTAGTGKVGSLYIMSVESNGSLTLTESHENIAGKIVDFMYKQL